MKVAILTMFNGLDNTYSLVNVVREQITSLLYKDIDVSLLVSEHCMDEERTGIFSDPRLKIIKVVNSYKGKAFNWKTYTKKEDTIDINFFREVEMIKNDYVKYLKDCDVCIMHDILYQGVHLIHNAAIRRAQKELDNVKFLSFTHSFPAKYIECDYPLNCMFSKMENNTFIYPTECGLDALALQYNTDKDNCAVVNNSINPILGMNDEVDILSKFIDFSSPDIIVVYPGRLNLSKRFHAISQMCGYIKTYTNKKVSVIFCDFPSSDIDATTYKAIIKDLGIKNGLNDNDIIFTSDCGFPYGVKRETVLNLFTLSNLYINPSFSESFGLTVIEASSRGNYIVLNEEVPALKEIGTTLGAYFMKWGAKRTEGDTIINYHPSEKEYFKENVIKIIENMDNNSVIKAKTITRKRYSNNYIFEYQLKPLLYK
ncbi:MAG: glycosyltransferase [Bacilli bacterium]